MTGPHAEDLSGGDLHALERQLVGNPQGPRGWGEGHGEDGGLNLLGDPGWDAVPWPADEPAP